jgi:hypothetical protein
VSAKPSEICCDWLEARLIASKFSKIVLGGTAASHTCSGVGGGHFLIKKSDHRCGWVSASGEKSRPWFFFGFKSRTHFYFLFSLVCVVSVIPKSNRRPPLTSFSGIRSSRRINLSLVRLRLLFPDSAARAFFLSFGVFTLVHFRYQHPCQVHDGWDKGRDGRYVCG